ncbi:RNA-directed DNA polymerase, eukaryota, partial [Tanacetum coccineum]
AYSVVLLSCLSLSLSGYYQCLFSCVAKLLELKFEWILPGLGRRVAFKDVEEKNATIKAFLTATQHTHAYHRTPLNETNVKSNKPGDIKSNSIHVAKKDTGANGVGNSYVHVVKGQMKSGIKEGDLSPALVLSDECLHIWESYGFCWNLGPKDSIKLFQDNVSIGSWFSQLKQANMEFNIEGRIAWVEVEGVPFKLWSDNTFNRIATKWGELLDIDDQDEMCFHSKRLCIYTKTEKNIFEEFKIIFRGKVFWIRAKEAPGWVPDFTDENDDEELNDEVSKEGELKIHEAGSCGEDSEVEEVMETVFEGSGQKNNLDKEHTDQKENYSEDPFDIYKMLNKKEVIESRNDHTVKLSDRIAEEVNNAFSGNGSNNNSKEDVSGSVRSGCFKKSEVPRTGGSLLSLMDELVKVGQVMGYKIEGCMNNMTEIIESQGVKEEHTDQKENYSEDPFDIYKMLNKKEVIVENEKNSRHSLKYPPGFTPKEGTDATGMNVEESRNDHTVKLSDRIAEEVNNAFSGNGSNNNSKEDVSGSVCSGRFKKSEVPRTGGSLLSLMDELVKVGQVMGYKMEGCLAQKAKKDWVKELCVKHKVNFLALQETKMEHMELFSVKMCWGNLVFDFVHSDSVVWRITGKDLLIIAVYAPNDNKDKQMLWDYLELRFGANVFNSFISSARLEDVPLGGSTFTWCHKSATKMSKLDRFLIFKNLFNSCLNISTIYFGRTLSDIGLPLFYFSEFFDYGPTPFRFFHYWIDMEGFSKVVEDAWREGPCDEANAMMNMMMKLKFLKTKIREWNKENMLNMKNVKAKHKEELEALEEIIDKGNGNEVVVNKRMEVVNTLQKIDKIHSFEMAQKAKVNWSIEGDENTSFFHGMLNKKRRQQNIRGIMIDGIWIDNPIRVKDEFFQHFSSRFDKPNARRAHIEMRYPKTITCDQQADLERDVSNEEIKRAVWDCGTDKSPGPDGFSFGFYRRFWYLIENDVYDAVKYFFTYGVIPKGCNSSFIALIPKSPGANTVKDFRPISLIGSVYKIIAKILANRLVGVLGDIVNEVDFEKAYDSVRWDFLDDILKKFGFGEKWCKWIQSCLRSSRGSIIINGSPTKEFQFFKGLKQGDPLSPFLFILIMESLHLSFQRVVDAGMFSGIKLSSSLNISHMFYADDVVFMGQWCDNNITTLVHVLECFYRASGLRINMSKSKIMGIHVVSDKVKSAATKLGCLILKTPFLYLGSVPLSVLLLAPKEKGGLGVSSLYALNRGLMFKWMWRFYTQNTSLWVRVIKAIHGDDGKSVRGYVIDGAKSVGCVLWIEVNTLKNYRYPRLFNLETCKSITVSMKLAQPGLGDSFRRTPRGGVEQAQFDELSALLQNVTVSTISDRWNWALESSGDFSVASVRKTIDDKLLPEVDSKTRWIKYVPIKVNVHAWKVKTDSLPTRFNISRRGIDIESITCAICDNGVETSSHVFFSCCMVRQIGCMIARWWDVPYVEVDSHEEWISWLVNLRISSKHKLMIEGVFYVMWWHLWSFRNKLMFEVKTPSKALFFEDVVSMSFHWCRIRMAIFRVNYTVRPYGYARLRIQSLDNGVDVPDHRAANCKMPKWVNPRQANMVNDNVNMIAMVSDVIAMISRVNLVGSNNSGWWVDTGATRHVCADKSMLNYVLLFQRRLTIERSCTWATLQLLISRAKEMLF